MPDALKKCQKEWKAYEKVMGNSNSSAENAKEVTNDLAKGLINELHSLSTYSKQYDWNKF